MKIFPEALSWEMIVQYLYNLDNEISSEKLNLNLEEADRIARILIREFLERELTEEKFLKALKIVRLDKKSVNKIK